MKETMELITCSYGPDLARCSRLCDSVDRYVPAAIRHTLIVPRRDQAKFAPLQNARRRILHTEDLVPGGYRQLRATDKMWMDRRGWPVRGWIMQQLTKLSANHATDAELILFADSDLQFVKPFTTDSIYRDGKLRLHRVPDFMNQGDHLNWHRTAGELLGRDTGYAGSDYIGQLVTWRSSHLQALQAFISQQQGKPWYQAVGRKRHLSEYILYGIFVEHVLGSGDNGHFYSAESPCYCCWNRAQAERLLQRATPLPGHALALHVQSNINFSLAEENRIFDCAQSASS